MFHLYFGAFDLVLYAGGFCGALILSQALSEERTAINVAELDEEDVLSTLALQPASSDINLFPMEEPEEASDYELMVEA